MATAVSASGPPAAASDAQSTAKLLVVVTDYDVELDSRSLELREIPLDGSPARPLLRGLPYGFEVVFSPDRRSFAYITSDERLLVVRVDGRERQIAARGVRNFAWHPRGERLAYVSNSRIPQIFTLRRDGTARTRLTRNTRRKTDRLSLYHAVAWSSDGTPIAFSHQLSNNHRPIGGSLYTMTSAGKRVTRVQLNGFVPEALAWSPKGRRLAVGGVVNCCILLFDGVRRTTVRGTGCCTGVRAVWSPDATRIAFFGGDYTQTSAGGVANLAARRVTVFDRFEGQVEAPAWSADSMRLAFVGCAQADDCDLYVATRDGDNPTRVENPEPNDVVGVTWTG